MPSLVSLKWLSLRTNTLGLLAPLPLPNTVYVKMPIGTLSLLKDHGFSEELYIPGFYRFGLFYMKIQLRCMSLGTCFLTLGFYDFVIMVCKLPLSQWTQPHFCIESLSERWVSHESSWPCAHQHHSWLPGHSQAHFSASLLLYELETHTDQASLELLFFMPQPPKCQNLKLAPPRPARWVSLQWGGAMSLNCGWGAKGTTWFL